MSTHPAETTPASYGAPPPLTMLDGLNDDFDEHPALTDAVDIPVPARPGWSLRCNTDIPYENLSAWRKAAQDPAMAVGTNEVKLACSILLFATTALLIEGEVVTDTDGQAVTFASEQLHAKLGVSRGVDAVRKMFRRDGFLTSASAALLRESGYGTESNPTRP
jgi:hypothetical protein